MDTIGPPHVTHHRSPAPDEIGELFRRDAGRLTSLLPRILVRSHADWLSGMTQRSCIRQPPGVYKACYDNVSGNSIGDVARV